MEFTSPRFAGNSILEDILNDPDTGTKKLKPGSPADAVRPVQRALLDLRWVKPFLTGAGQLLLEVQFVDGGYGEWTTKTLFDYKTHYNIRFPPGDPQGFVDGFAGPRTMRALDDHCALLDEADAAITLHARELLVSGAVSSLELAAPDGAGRTTRPTRNCAGAQRSAVINGEVGGLIFKRGLGAFALFGPLFVEWVTQELALGTGDATGQVGFPRTDMSTSGTISSVDVERGTMSFDSVTGLPITQIDPALSIQRQEIEF